MSDVVVKYCPMCDKPNPAFSSFCEECDGDLLQAPAVPRRDLVSAEPAEVEEGPGSARSVGDVSTSTVPPGPVLPTEQSEIRTKRAVAPGASLQLELLENPALTFLIQPGQTVGRAEQANVILKGVPNLEYISRAHAQFSQRRGQWFVQYVAEGNFITVDGKKYSDDSEVAIYENSTIVLSLTTFRVRLGH